MFRQHGGAKGFAQAWHGAIKEARARGKDCSVLRSFRVLMEIAVASQQLNQEVDDARVANMGPTELAKEQLEMAIDLIKHRPAIFREAARRLDLEIRPLKETTA